MSDRSEISRLQDALAAAEVEVERYVAVAREETERRHALEALLAETRKKALEEAAKVAEMRHWTWKQDIAAAIRSISNEEAPK